MHSPDDDPKEAEIQELKKVQNVSCGTTFCCYMIPPRIGFVLSALGCTTIAFLLTFYTRNTDQISNVELRANAFQHINFEKMSLFGIPLSLNVSLPAAWGLVLGINVVQSILCLLCTFVLSKPVIPTIAFIVGLLCASIDALYGSLWILVSIKAWQQVMTNRSGDSEELNEEKMSPDCLTFYFCVFIAFCYFIFMCIHINTAMVARQYSNYLQVRGRRRNLENKYENEEEPSQNGAAKEQKDNPEDNSDSEGWSEEDSIA
eukprot:45683_1